MDDTSPCRVIEAIAGDGRDPGELVRLIKSHFAAARQVGRGVCLLNAGEYDKAREAFLEAETHGSTDRSLPEYLAACLLGTRGPGDAVDVLGESVRSGEDETRTTIRHALALWAAGRREDALTTLRRAVAADAECAELHFQLGTLLTCLDEYEEAELRFTQAVSIDRNHAEALMSLAMCCGVRGEAAEAVVHLQRAQARRPNDARIGLLLAQAAKSARDTGHAVEIRATPSDPRSINEQRGIEELSRVIENEPDFVDAFLSIPPGEVDEGVFAMLLKTLRAALERQPEHAELHYHCGRVLGRLGRHEDAIDANVRAVQLDPRFTRALIELGKLYQRTNRADDAMTRLEQAVDAGAEYADVYYVLGNLYRACGNLTRARSAYRRALDINHYYADASRALASLPGG